MVSFSGDKLLGGPQAGLVVGRADLIDRMNANPLKRALRLDKARLAALEQVLLLYLRPERLAETLPTLRLLTRPAAEIRATAQRIGAAVTAVWPDRPVAVEACQSQIGSGALPVDLLAILCSDHRRKSAGRACHTTACAAATGDRPAGGWPVVAGLPLPGSRRMNRRLLPSCGSGGIFALEEKRSRWAGRPSKPVGAAWRLRVGSTPALFRRLWRACRPVLPCRNTVPENRYPPSRYGHCGAMVW